MNPQLQYPPYICLPRAKQPLLMHTTQNTRCHKMKYTLVPILIHFPLQIPLPCQISRSSQICMEDQIDDITSSLTSILKFPSNRSMDIPLELLESQAPEWDKMLLAALHNGNMLNPDTVMKSLRHTWRIHTKLEIIPKFNNRYVCTFTKLQDKLRVLDEQPWQTLGHLFFVKEYTPNMNEEEVVFDSIPIWIRFKGLEFEHYKSETIELIAAAAGIVKTVVPAHGLPRTSEGFKAKVEIEITKPLNMGVLVNTLNKGRVFIEFIYIGLPDSFCVNCRRIGHERFDCPFPSLTDEAHHDASTTAALAEMLLQGAQNSTFQGGAKYTGISLLTESSFMLIDATAADADSLVPPIYTDSILMATNPHYPIKPKSKPVGAKPYNALADLGIIDALYQHPPPKRQPKMKRNTLFHSHSIPLPSIPPTFPPEIATLNIPLHNNMPTSIPPHPSTGRKASTRGRARGRKKFGSVSNPGPVAVDSAPLPPVSKRRRGTMPFSQETTRFVVQPPSIDTTDQSWAQLLDFMRQPLVANQLIVQGMVHPNAFGNMGNSWKLDTVQDVDEMHLLGAQIQGMTYQIPRQQLNISSPNSITLSLQEPILPDQINTIDDDGNVETRGQPKDKGKSVMTGQQDDPPSSDSFSNINSQDHILTSVQLRRKLNAEQLHGESSGPPSKE